MSATARSRASTSTSTPVGARSSSARRADPRGRAAVGPAGPVRAVQENCTPCEELGPLKENLFEQHGEILPSPREYSTREVQGRKSGFEATTTKILRGTLMGGRTRVLMGGAALAVLLTAGAPVLAAEAADTESTVDAVIVTAAKREQDVQDVAISMNVASQEQLEQFNIADMKGLSTTVPSMVVLRTNSVNTITLRGFGSGPNNPATDQTVALYNDGVYAGRARQFMAPYFDVARVEILRGPQGALIGKNTAAGAISIVSNLPTRTFQAEATANYLITRDGIDAYGFVSGPITDKLRARLAVKVIDDEGWVRNTATGNKDPRQDFFNIRGIVTWDAAEHLENTAKFQYDDNKVDGRAMVGFPANLTKDQAVRLEKTTSGLFGQTDHDYQKGYHGAITATLGLGDLTLVSVTGYEEFRSDSGA